MKASIPSISRMTLMHGITLMIPIGLCVVQILTIVRNPASISYGGGATVTASETSSETSSESSSETSLEQRDTFVPHPNHPPLFTKGSGTR